MKKNLVLLVVFLIPPLSAQSLEKEFRAMIDSSFVASGQANKSRLKQSDLQKTCSAEKPPAERVLRKIEQSQYKSIKYPSDGNYFGDWKNGERLSYSGRGLTWTDEVATANGGGCYNCHQLSHKEIAYGTLGVSLLDYGINRKPTAENLRYTWGKIYDSKAFNGCSAMPRFGHAGILSEAQMKDLMSYLFDSDSPVNKK